MGLKSTLKMAEAVCSGDGNKCYMHFLLLRPSLDFTWSASRMGLLAKVKLPSSVIEPLAQLKRLLEADDGEASYFALDARPRLLNVLTASEANILIRQVSDFAYADALRCLASIASRHCLPLE